MLLKAEDFLVSKMISIVISNFAYSQVIIQSLQVLDHNYNLHDNG